MVALETKGLTHQFASGEFAIHDVSLSVASGSIYGFLGPNGAGKTTTLRLILGLLKKQSGSISVFGKTFEDHRIEVLRKIGSLIESPSLYAHLSAYDNLNVLRTIYQCPSSRIQEVLDLVGLPSTGKKKAGQFSLGMKQRLSIAVALLHDPDFLILDEPTNGLDPNGMIEIRELLLKLNQERGTTILISSHLLAEIDRLVTHAGIISKGQMLFEGTLSELKDRQQQSLSVVLVTGDQNKTHAILERNHISSEFRDERFILPAISKEQIAHINEQLVQEGIAVYELSTVRNDLESIFIKLINQ